MFETLTPAKPDPILTIMAAFREDKRADKIDLSVGVYKDEAGGTPIVAALREAETRLHAGQKTKAYIGPLGDAGFNEKMLDLTFGPDVERARLRTAQTPGGCGGLRLLGDLIAAAQPDATVFMPDPTWVNHEPLLASAGLRLATYAYFDPTTGAVRFDAMMADLGKARAGDVILLHGCCHNPTGADLDMVQWKTLGAFMLKRGLFPLVDLAYQGLAFGLEEDAAPVRYLASILPEMAVATSCSKNFAAYRDRVGAAFILGASPTAADIAGAKLATIGRGMWSMPPDHGAAAIRIVLEDAGLTAMWKAELNGMRTRIQTLRANLASELNRLTNADFSFVTRQTGMFSRLPLADGQAQRLRAERGVYILPDGRINIAGLNATNTAPFAEAFAETR
ncbi:MAG: amino acid aminotransferase [Rhodoblastus sp.]